MLRPLNTLNWQLRLKSKSVTHRCTDIQSQSCALSRGLLGETLHLMSASGCSRCNPRLLLSPPSCIVLVSESVNPSQFSSSLSHLTSFSGIRHILMSSVAATLVVVLVVVVVVVVEMFLMAWCVTWLSIMWLWFLSASIDDWCPRCEECCSLWEKPCMYLIYRVNYAIIITYYLQELASFVITDPFGANFTNLQNAPLCLVTNLHWPTSELISFKDF